MNHLRLALLLPMAAGCTTHENVTPINDAMVAEARIIDMTLGALAFMGGSAGLNGTLEATTTDGLVLTEPVQLSLGLFGFGVSFAGSGGSGDLNVQLPLGGPIEGHKLFGLYEGTYEVASAIGGVQTLSVINKPGVKLETTQFASLFGFEVAWVKGELFVVVPEPEDTGDTSDSGDTAHSGSL